MDAASSTIVAWAILCAVVLAAPLHAQGKKPKKEEKPITVQDVKEAANKALIAVDKGVHSAIGPAKKGANDALQSIDDTLHGRKK